MAGAAKRAFEDGAKARGDDGPRPRRIDLELAGHEVMWVIAPQESTNLSGIDFGGEAEDEESPKELQEKLAKAPRTVVSHGHAVVTRVGPRLVMAGFETPARKSAAGKPTENAGDEDAERDMEAARGSSSGSSPPMRPTSSRPSRTSCRAPGCGPAFRRGSSSSTW